MAIEKTALTVPFGEGDGNGLPIRIELLEGPAYGGWQVLLKVYANNDYPLYRATIGTVGYIESKQRVVEGEALVFSGSDSATLEYPPSAAGPTIRAVSRAFDEYGAPTTVGVTWDNEQQAVKASKKFYGIVEVSYIAPYRVVGYNYAQEIVEVGTSNGTTPITNTINKAGWVFAYVVTERPRLFGYTPSANERPRFAAFQIPDYELTFDFGGSVDRIELYRQVSFAILTEDGMYEKSTTGDGLDFVPSTYSGYTVENKRTHVVGYMDRYGRRHELSYDIPPAQPYESQRLEAKNNGYPAKTWEFTEFSEPDQTYDDSSLLADAIGHVSTKKKEVGE